MRQLNKEPTISFRNDKNLFYASITYHDYFGNSQRKTFYGASVNIVKNKIAEFQKIQALDVPEEEKFATIPQLLKIKANKDYKMNTIRQSSYKRRLETIKIIEKHKIATVPIIDIDEKILNSFLIFLVNCNYSNSTIRKVYESIKSILKDAVNRGHIPVSPIVKFNIKAPKSNKADKVVVALTVDEQKALVKAIDAYKPHKNTANKTLQILVQLYSGMRIGEVNALRISDVDFTRKKLTVCGTIENGIDGKPFRIDMTKTKSGMRKIPINDKLESVLKRAIEAYVPNNENLLFYDNIRNRPFSNQSMNTLLSKLCKTANIRKISTHTLRHTFATRLVEMNVPFKIIQQILGHNDIRITLNTYASVLDDSENSALNQINNGFSEL